MKAIKPTIKMKRGNKLASYLFVFSVIILLSSCSTSQKSISAYDDVYYSPKDEPVIKAEENKINEPPIYTLSENIPTNNTEQYSSEDNSKADYSYQQYLENNNGQVIATDSTYQDVSYSEPYSELSGNTYVTNNYYEDEYAYDDYYDYAYSARIKRFYRPALGWSYYNDYYTNAYWYDYNPDSWGVSIYLGYDWWWPSYYYGPSWSFGFSWGWGSFGWGYPSYWGWGGYPYYGWGGYWNGYYDGFYDGYWAGSHDYYYNSFDRNSTYYGPRRDGSSSTGRRTAKNNTSLGQKYERAIALENTGIKGINTTNNNPRISTQPIKTATPAISTNPVRSTVADKQITPTNRTVAPAMSVSKEINASSNQIKQPAVQQTTPSVTVQDKGEKAYNKYRATHPNTSGFQQNRSTNSNLQTNPSQRNAGSTPTQSSQPKTYSSPNYNQPRTSQEYVKPSSRIIENYSKPAKTNEGQSQPQQRSVNKQYSTPQQNSRPSQAAPSRNNNVSTPSRSVSPSSQPSSTPSRTSAPATRVSAPASSHSSFSSPARSSGSSSGGSGSRRR